SGINGATLEDRQGAAKAALACSFEHFEACTQLLSNAVVYTSIGQPNGFPDQLKKNPSSPSLYITVPWTDLSRNTIPRVLTTEVTTARQQLTDIFDKILPWKLRVDRLLNQGVPLPALQEAALQDWKEKLTSNLRAVNAAVQQCYDNLTYDPNNGNQPFQDKVS